MVNLTLCAKSAVNSLARSANDCAHEPSRVLMFRAVFPTAATTRTSSSAAHFFRLSRAAVPAPANAPTTIVPIASFQTSASPSDRPSK
ncbi:hypothetical protein STENM327S_04026 [Streptomyces tendae]